MNITSFLGIIESENYVIVFKSMRSGDDRMKAKVNQDLCISCGLCVSSCPEVFSWNGDEKAEATADKIAEDQEDCARDAAEGCPTDAIETEE
jgi:ferredoxin